MVAFTSDWLWEVHGGLLLRAPVKNWQLRVPGMDFLLEAAGFVAAGLRAGKLLNGSRQVLVNLLGIGEPFHDLRPAEFAVAFAQRAFHHLVVISHDCLPSNRRSRSSQTQMRLEIPHDNMG